jgi:Family of unknown function (DUF5755)
MVRFSSKCPPGVVCLSPGTVFFTIAVIFAVGFLIMQNQMHNQRQVIAPTPVNVQVSTDSGGDDRFTRAPKPERNWVATPDLSAVWNSSRQNLPAIPTRGIPESYQSMGILKMEDGQVLPLYGRRTASRSDRFQYYSRTDSYNPVQLPIQYKGRNCQDDVGCEELYDRDRVHLSGIGKKGEVTIYRFSGPTYIPGIV